MNCLCLHNFTSNFYRTTLGSVRYRTYRNARHWVGGEVCHRRFHCRSSRSYTRTSEEHFLEETVDGDESVLVGGVQLLDDEPADRLEGGQQQQQLAEPAPHVVLPVAHVVVEQRLRLTPNQLHTRRRVAQTSRVCVCPAQENKLDKWLCYGRGTARRAVSRNFVTTHRRTDGRTDTRRRHVSRLA